MSGRDYITGPVRDAVARRRYQVPALRATNVPDVAPEVWTIMRAAELECDREKRPVSLLIGRQPVPPNDMPWLDERMEHLAVRRDASE